MEQMKIWLTFSLYTDPPVFTHYSSQPNSSVKHNPAPGSYRPTYTLIVIISGHLHPTLGLANLLFGPGESQTTWLVHCHIPSPSVVYGTL